MASEIKVDTISEKTSANGVTIDSVVLKDNKVDVNGTAGGIILDADADTHIGANTDDVIVFTSSGTGQVTLSDGAFSPVTDNDVDLGTNSLEFKDGYFDGTVYADAINFNGTAISATAAEINYSDLATLGTTAASKVFSADANNLTKITGGVYLEEDTLSFDATQDWDVRASPVAKVTLTNNVTFDAPSNPTTGQYISIVCIQDGTGSRTIAWNAVFEFKDDTAPTATTTASKGDMFTFRYNGSKWLEVGRNLNLTLS